MQLFSEYTAWQSYAALQLAEAEVEEKRAEARVKNAEAMYMVSYAGSKVTEIRAAMSTDAQILALRQQEIEAYALRKMHGAMASNYERCANLVSRELSRRIGGNTPTGRSNRWNP